MRNNLAWGKVNVAHNKFIVAVFNRLPSCVKRFYYRTKLHAWAILHLPRNLNVADTNYTIPAWCWQVAIPCRIDTTRICYEGMSRDQGRMFYEPIEFPKFKEILVGRKIFFDVGANIGYYSYLAVAGGVKQVVAFEFMEEYAAFTRDAFRRNHIPGEVINKGVGNPGAQASYSDPLAGVTGNMLSLDEFAKERGIYPDIMKMDIEGFELDALRNAHEILMRKPAIDISVHPAYLEARGQSAKEVLDLLANYGYRIMWSGGDTYFMKAD